MSEQKSLSFERLKQAVDRGVAAIRAVSRLQPAGGPGDKVFPPTYTKEGKATTKYALEERRIDGQKVTCVLLDSVASQANRMEQALLEEWRRQSIHLPVARVDFSESEGLADLGDITVLDAPHRIADAIFRDSLLDGVSFRESNVGKAITAARPDHATAMYRYCPTALIFGVWDSTGPKGGSGSKFQRALVSEIIGVDAVTGVKTGSRLDPLETSKNVTIYEDAKNPTDWTLDQTKAAKEKGKLKLFSRKGSSDKGKPAIINHGNIPPSIDEESGGVTIDHALQTTVLSLPALRRLRFRKDMADQVIPADGRDARELAARTNLTALALCAIVHVREHGYDLRSRALLIPDSPMTIELVPANGAPAERYQISPEEASSLLAEASKHAESLNFGWHAADIKLNPSDKLAALIRESRRQQINAEDSE